MDKESKMYFQYALVAKDSTILAEKALIEWDYREISLSLLENRDPNEMVIKFEKKPNTYHSIIRPDGMVFLCVCMSKIPDHVQERFLHNLEEKWKEKQNWLVKLFSKKVDFGETEITSLIQKYNVELDEKIKSYVSELGERRNQLEEQKKEKSEQILEAFKRGAELDMMERKTEHTRDQVPFHRDASKVRAKLFFSKFGIHID